MIGCKNLSKSGCIILILFSILHISSIPASADWQTTTINTGTGPVDITVDSSGRAHIAYRSDNNYGSLDYASNVTGVWTKTNVVPVSTSPQVGVYNSIAVDSNSKAHISYINTDNTLNYAENINGAWTRQSLTTAPITGMGVSIAVDSNNKEHIAYIDNNIYGNSCLKYATNAYGAWATTTLGTCDSTSYAAYPAIAIDSSTKVHISYTGLDGLQYANNASGSWVISSLGSGEVSNIATDSNNKAHIVYRTMNTIMKKDSTGTWYQATVYSGIYTTNASGAWISTTLTADRPSFESPSIAIDSNNNVHVSFIDDNSIIYTTNSSGIWIKTTLDTEFATNYASIALDSNNRPHISYVIMSTGSMNYSVKYVYDGLTGSVAINAGAGYTNTTSASISLSCAYSGVGCAEMKFSDDDTNWSTAEPYSTTKPFTLSSGDGTKTVYVKFKDANGNWSKSYSGAIVLDTAQPNTTIYSNPPNPSSYASFGVGSSEGGSSFQCQLDGSGYGSCAGTVACGYSSCTSSISFVGLTEGSHTFDVRAIDSAANTDATPASYTWTIDSTVPAGTIAINSGAASTNSTTTTLTLTCTDTNGCSQMQFSNDNSTWSTAETYATSKTWTLSSGEGTKTVYVKFKDNAGNWSTSYSDTIKLDTTAPATTASPAGGTYTSTQSATLTCTDGTGSGCDKIYYTTDGTTPTTASTVYLAAISITATKTLKYFAKDLAGNSEIVNTQTYTIDATAPTGTISINSGAASTNFTTATLTLTCTDTNGCAEMQFSNDNSTWSTAETYATSKTWTLSSGEGTKTVYAKFKDTVGNWSAAYSDTIKLDATAPVTTASPAGGTYASAQNVALTCSDGSGSGCDKIYYTTDGTTPTTASTVYNGPITISTNSTVKYFAVDLAGNSETVKTQTYTIDGVNPVFSSISPASDSFINTVTAGYSLSEAVSSGKIIFTRTGGTADSTSHVYNFTSSDITAGSHSINTGLALVNGAIYTVAFEAVDLAGNTGTVTSTNITYNKSSASVTINSPASNSVTNNAEVTYTLTEDITAGNILFTRTGGKADGMSPYTYPLSSPEMTTGSHTVDTGNVLMDGAIYTISFENVMDMAGNATATVSNTSVTYDATAVAITNTSPASNSIITNSTVTYSLSEQASSGKITFTWSGGAADPSSPHVYTFTQSDMTAGPHTINTNLNLVDGAFYTMSFDAADLVGNAATTVSTAMIFYDSQYGIGPIGNVDNSSYSNNRVDGFDLIKLSLAFGSSAGDANWNPVCDLDGDGIIDGNDLMTLGVHFGEVQ